MRPIAMTMGDPAGVGPQIAWAAWDRLRSENGRPFFVAGSAAVLETVSGGRPLRTIEQASQAASAFAHALPVLPLDCPVVAPGQPDVATVAATAASIRLCVELVQTNHASAVVTNPIAKSLMYRGGFEHPGHTEYLAALAGGVTPVMMLVGGGLRVALATIHRPLASVPASLTIDLIDETARIVDAALRRDFGLERPRIGLCGLNPHAGEDGALGLEEAETINPAAARLRNSGLDVSNARPGDTIFHEHLAGQFDAVIAMYHDQGLIPVKTLDMWGGVNVTLGLPFIRTSPDHGVAYDAAAKRAARPDSLLAAIRLADQMARVREAT